MPWRRSRTAHGVAAQQDCAGVLGVLSMLCIVLGDGPVADRRKLVPGVYVALPARQRKLFWNTVSRIYLHTMSGKYPARLPRPPNMAPTWL